MRYHRTRVALTGLALASIAAPALAAGSAPGGVEHGSSADRTSAPLGPSLPAIDWSRELPGDVDDLRTSVILDARGHALLQGTRSDDTTFLTAVARDGGATAWTVDGVDPACAVAADDRGVVYAATTAGTLVALNAATGAVNATFTPSGDEPEVECEDALRLTRNGAAVVWGTESDFTPYVQAVDTASMTQAWLAPLQGRYRDRRVVVAPSGDLYTVTKGDTGLVVHRLDGSGNVTATAEVAGQGVDDHTLTADGSGVAFQAGSCEKFTDCVVRLDADLDPVFTVTLSDGRDDVLADASFWSMALVDGHVVGWIRDHVVSLDGTSGRIRWVHRTSADSNNDGQLVVDGAGDLYTSTFGGSPLESLSPDGTQRFAVAEDFLPTEARGISLVDPDGGLVVWHRESNRDPFVVSRIANGTKRLVGTGSSEPIDVAIEICQYLFADGTARSIVLSRDDVFADALAGAPLAGDESCILYTPGGPDAQLDPRTLAEVKRVLPAGGTVHVLGGTFAVSKATADRLQSEGFRVDRLSGSSRFETAARIARAVVAGRCATSPERTSAGVAYGGNWPDAVTGGAHAAAACRPILLTETDRVPDATRAAIRDLGITRTTVFGGTGVVSDQAAAQLPSPTRVFGSNRFATATEVATQLWSDRAAGDAFVLANLEVEKGWALSLAAAPLSAILDAPQVGVAAKAYPAATEAYLEQQGVDTTPGLYVLGDVTVIDDGVVAAAAGDVGQG